MVEFPRLSKMAFNILPIPQTSCDCERVFSESKLVVGTQRHSLKDDSIEMLEFLKFRQRELRRREQGAFCR